MRIYALLEASLDTMLKRWVLRCQQELVDADIDVEIMTTPLTMLSMYDAEIDLVQGKQTIMTIAQYNDVGRFPFSIAITFPMRQFLQDANDICEPHIFDQVMQSVINQAPKQ